MKMSYVDFTSSTFRITFCVAGEKAEVIISPLVDDEWVTTTIGDNYYDVNLWLDDNVGKSKEGIIKFGVYHVKPDPDNSYDGMWIMDSKVACSNECPESSIELINC